MPPGLPPRTSIVLDNGADRLKAGLAGDPKPRFSIPNCTAKLKGQLHVSPSCPMLMVMRTPSASTPPNLIIISCVTLSMIQVLVGDEIELVQNTANLQYSRPFDRGYLNTWDSEYQVWRRLLGDQKLKVCACH